MNIIWFALSAQVGAGGASWPWGWQRPAHWGRRRVQHLSQEDDALLQIQTKPDGKLNYNFENIMQSTMYLRWDSFLWPDVCMAMPSIWIKINIFQVPILAPSHAMKLSHLYRFEARTWIMIMRSIFSEKSPTRLLLMRLSEILLIHWCSLKWSLFLLISYSTPGLNPRQC